MSYLTVKNWERFQHYKDRNPPWIKLHFELLSSETWVMLDDASRVLAVASMLIASRNEGRVPNNPDYVQRVAYLNKKPNFKPLIDAGFFVKPLATASICEQAQADARPETEAYREETETDKNKPTIARERVTLESLSVDHIADWLSKKRSEGRYINHNEHEILEKFKTYCQSKGKKYADYAAAYRGAFDWDKCQPQPANRSGYQPQPSKTDRGKAAVMRAAEALGFAE